MKILITGAAGFIGSHLWDALEADGHEVHGVDNFLTGDKAWMERVHALDIADRLRFYSVANTFAPELVIHCAASYSDPNLWHRDTDTNISGTINTINVARYHDARLIYFQTALPPISSYAISKIAGEQYIRISDVPWLIFRLANVYGPRNISGPIPTFFKRLTAGEPCSAVKTERDLVYIDDLVRCVLLALERDRLGSYDVCSGYPVSISDLYLEVAAHFWNAPGAKLVELSEEDVMPDTSVHNWLQGWSPSTDLSDGVAAAVRWYREHGVEQTFTHLAVKG